MAPLAGGERHRRMGGRTKTGGKRWRARDRHWLGV